MQGYWWMMMVVMVYANDDKWENLLEGTIAGDLRGAPIDRLRD